MCSYWKKYLKLVVLLGIFFCILYQWKPLHFASAQTTPTKIIYPTLTPLPTYAPPVFPVDQTVCASSGDINCDTQVNAADYFYSIFHRGKVQPGADSNNDGIVDEKDSLILLQHYGEKKQEPPRKDVLIIIDSTLLSAIQTDITTFASDIKTKLNITVRTIPFINIATVSPLTIRQKLQQECGPISELGCQNIEGAIFVGNVPYERYFSPYNTLFDDKALFVYYYEDLDATFNKESHGYYQGYQSLGNFDGPEIYSAWIPTLTYGGKNYYSATISPRSEITQLHEYFDKHHRFFSGQSLPSPNAGIVVHAPIAASPLGKNQLSYVYTDTHVTEIAPDVVDNICPLKPALNAFMDTKPELLYIHSHGSQNFIWCNSADDFLSQSGLPLLAFSWGCNNGNFDTYLDSSIALAFIHGKDMGLTYFSKLHADDMALSASGAFLNMQDEFVRLWNRGDYIGNVYLTVERENRAKLDWISAANDKKILIKNLYRESGPLQRIIVGSPFVYSPTARQKFLEREIP